MCNHFSHFKVQCTCELHKWRMQIKFVLSFLFLSQLSNWQIHDVFVSLSYSRFKGFFYFYFGLHNVLHTLKSLFMHVLSLCSHFHMIRLSSVKRIYDQAYKFIISLSTQLIRQFSSYILVLLLLAAFLCTFQVLGITFPLILVDNYYYLFYINTWIQDFDSIACNGTLNVDSYMYQIFISLADSFFQEAGEPPSMLHS